MGPRKEREVYARIKRFDDQWATCGVGILPPDNMRNVPGLKRRCPKLTPGQVVKVPVSHPLLRQRNVEIVDGPEADEFVRPIVFATVEDAAMANVAKSRVGIERVREGLALTEGAHVNAPKLREAKREEALAQFDEIDFVGGGPDPDFVELETDEQLARRSANRLTKDAKSDLTGDDDVAPATPAPRMRKRRNRVAEA